VIALLLGGLAAALVGGYRHLALRHGWLDTPNDRSLHRHTVPRGAGIVVVALVAVAAAPPRGLPIGIFFSFLPGLGIAAVGWWDDLRGVPARLRFLLYGICSALALVALQVFPLQSPAGWCALAAAALAFLWLINLYNFMDGINGLAAFEAIFLLAAGLALSPYSPYALLFEPLASSAMAILAGFLCWNFPRARVFMGDVGSVFLGFLLGLFALWSQGMGGPGIATWCILGAVFIADTSYTLLVRIATGQRWYEGHRTHAYQKLSLRWNSHVKTVAAIMGVNLAWLLPLAWALESGLLSAPFALLLAYLPLVGLNRALKAGIPAGTKV
jgi:Fuc2NAc and GlcNAc transferase